MERQRWTTIGLVAGLVLAIVPLVFFWSPWRTLLARTINNLGHIPLFALITSLLIVLARRWLGSRLSAAFQYAGVFGLALFLSFLTELIQMLGPRDADFSDLALNGVGAALAVLWWVTFDRRFDGTSVRRRSGRVVLRIVAIVVFLAFLSPLIRVWEAYREREDRLPILYSYDSPSQQRFMSSLLAVFEPVAPPAAWDADPPDPVLHLRYSRYEGGVLILNEPYGDWRDYSALVVDVFHPGTDKIEIGIGVDDSLRPRRYRHRFNARIWLEPGLNRLRFPIEEIAAGPVERELNVARIKRIVVFAVHPVGGFELYLGPIRLEATPSTSPG